MNTVNGIDIEAPVEVEAAVAAGPRTIYGQLRYQGCTPATCLMPTAQPVEAEWRLDRIRVATTRRNYKEKAMQTLTSNELDMWSFYEPGDWPMAKTNADFIWFLLSPSTQSMEVVSLDCDHITFALYGPPGEDGVPGVVRNTLERESTQLDERKLIVAAINESYPGDPCEKRRMARTIAAYFDVPWKVAP